MRIKILPVRRRSGQPFPLQSTALGREAGQGNLGVGVEGCLYSYRGRGSWAFKPLLLYFGIRVLVMDAEYIFFIF